MRKNWCLLLRFAVAMALSPLVLITVFPATFDVLLHSARGEELIGKVNVVPNMKMRLDSGIWQGGIWEILRRVDLWLESLSYSDMWKIYFQQLWGFSAFYIVSLELLLCVILLYVCLRKTKPCAAVWYVLVVCVLMSMFLSRYMPPMYEFSVRYYMLLLPLMSVLTFYLLKVLLAFWEIPSKGGYILLGCFVLVNLSISQGKERGAFRSQNFESTRMFEVMVEGRDVLVQNELGNHFSFFERLWYLRGARRVYVSFDVCDEAFITEIIHARNPLVLIFNDETVRCVRCFPKRQALVCDRLKPYLKFMFSIKTNEYAYDVYEVLKGE